MSKDRRASSSADTAEVRERISHQCVGGSGFTGRVSQLPCGTGRHNMNLFGRILFSLLQLDSVPY